MADAHAEARSEGDKKPQAKCMASSPGGESLAVEIPRNDRPLPFVRRAMMPANVGGEASDVTQTGRAAPSSGEWVPGPGECGGEVDPSASGGRGGARGGVTSDGGAMTRVSEGE